MIDSVRDKVNQPLLALDADLINAIQESEEDRAAKPTTRRVASYVLSNKSSCYNNFVAT